MADNISVEAAASLGSLVAVAIGNSKAAAAAAVPEAEERSVHEFTDSLQRLLEALRHTSAAAGIPAAGIPSIAAEAACMSSNFQARFEIALACIEQLCEDLLQAAEVAERARPWPTLTATADRSPESSDADGRSPRGHYTPRRETEELLSVMQPWARASINLIRARGPMFQVSPDIDKAMALNREALDELGHLLGVSEHPACTKLHVEQLLRLMHDELRMYGSDGRCDDRLAVDAWILHQSWRESYTRARNHKRYRARKDSQQELDADSVAEAATPAPAAEAATPAAEAATPATLATAVAVHVGRFEGESFKVPATALATVRAAVALPQSPGSESDYSYSSYSSYSDDVEAAPAAAGAAPPVVKSICKQPAMATAVDTRCAHGCGRTPRAGCPLNFKGRVKLARRAAGKAVTTASRSASIGSLIPEVLNTEGAAAAAENVLTSAVATAAVEQALRVPPMDPTLQAEGWKQKAKPKSKPKSKAKHKAKPKSTAQKTAASAAAAAPQNAAAAAAPAAPRAKRTRKKLVASAAPNK